MAKVDIIVLFICLTYLYCVSAKCPFECDRRRDAYKCCSRDKVVCCQGSGRTDDCYIADPPVSVEQVFVRNCRMQHLSQSSLVNISKHPVGNLQFEDVTFDNIDSEPFGSLPMLRKVVIQKSNDLNITALSEALDGIQGSKNVSITLNDIGIKDKHMNILFGKSVASKIVYLNLKRNELETLPLDILHQLPNLHIAIFEGNILSKLSVGTVKNLRSLVLDDNRMANGTVWQNINGHLPSLTSLGLINNGISSMSFIEWRCLPSLKYLNLKKNCIQYLNFTALQSLKQLETLDLSRNWMTNHTILKGRLPVISLRNIMLSGNNFPQFPPWFCSRNETTIFQNLEYLDLSNNQLKYPVADAWRCLHNLKVLKLRENPIVKIKNNTFAHLSSLDELVLSYNRNGGIVSAEAAAFNNSNLQRLYLEGNSLRFSENATLLEIFKYTRNLTELNLSYNRLDGLNDSKLTTLLSPLRNLKRLILNRCYLNQLPSGLLEKYRQLTTLSLDKNRFETHNLPTSLQGVVNLQNLSLANNFIRVIHHDSIPRKLTLSLTHLNLADNPFDCSCDNIWLFDQIKRYEEHTIKLHIVSWPAHYQCRTPETASGHLLRDFHLDEKKCDPLYGTVVAYSTTGCFLFVFIVTTIIIYRFRWYCTYWRYKMKRKQEVKKDPEEQPILRNKPTYDAYSIYSQKDESVGSFLATEFGPMMDTFGYNVFIWDRDAGAGATVSEIGDAMYGSKNAIAIITNSFLKDPWCKFQIEVALDREIELKREFLTIVVLEEVDFKLLSKFWCVRFTKTPTMRWCSAENDVRRKVLEIFIQKQFHEPEMVYRRR